LLFDLTQCLAALECIAYVFVEDLFGLREVAIVRLLPGELDVELFLKLSRRFCDGFD
jgi:hypothetical protein